MYNDFSDRKYFGFYNFTTPIIAIRDLELTTSMAIKNFDHFTDHQSFIIEDLEPMMRKNLLSLRGDDWREMRRLLSPVFTAAKMKTMFNLITDYTDSFSRYVAAESKGGKVYDLKDTFGRYTTDVLATSCFGVAVDSMRNPNNEFYVFAKQLINVITGQSLKVQMAWNFPFLLKLFGVRLFNEKMRRYFTSVVNETVKRRKAKGIYRPDMIQLLLESRGLNGKALTIEEITNNAFIFFMGGFETTTRFLCFVAHELAANPKVQARLRDEIEEVARKYKEKPTYEAVRDMPYMDAVLNETSRMYPSTPFLDRTCVKEFELPPATPDSKPVTIEPGTFVWFLPYSIQRDPKYFPEPFRFNPDRFLRGTVPQNAYMSFGIGPRLCIGNRLAIMEAKILFFNLLLRCELEPCAQTTLPMRLCKKNVLLAADKGFWLNFKTRKTGTALRGDGVDDDEI